MAKLATINGYQAQSLKPPPAYIVCVQDGMDDESFEQLLVPVMDTIMERYQPDAIVLQSGERQHW